MAAPIANRSTAGPSSNASAADSARACGAAIVSINPRAGRSTASRPPKGTSRSGSVPIAEQDPEAVEPALGPAEQGGLADSRLTGDGEHATGTDPRPGDEPIDDLLLVLATDQHAASLEVSGAH